MNKDLKYMPIDNRASGINNNGSPFRNNAIKKMESSALFNHIDGHPKPVSKENPFGPAPEGFGDSRTGSFRREVTPTKRSLKSLENEFETKIILYFSYFSNKYSSNICGKVKDAKPINITFRIELSKLYELFNK